MDKRIQLDDMIIQMNLKMVLLMLFTGVKSKTLGWRNVERNMMEKDILGRLIRVLGFLR